MWLELPLGGGGYLLPPLGAGPGPWCSWQWWAELAASSGLRPGTTLIQAQMCGWDSPSGSSAKKEPRWICREKTAVIRMGGGEGEEQILLCVFPSLPFSSPGSSTAQVDSQAHGNEEPSRGSSAFPTPTTYLEGFAYSHHRMQIVAIVTEEKLALGLRDVTDIEVNLVGRTERNGVSSLAQGPTQLSLTSYPTLRSFQKTEKRPGKPSCWETWYTYLREAGRYLAQPVAEGDLVVPDPDIGHIVINVAQPHLWERGLGSQWSGRTQHL